MKKIETIWHHLLWSAIEKQTFRFTQAGLSAEFGYSLSTVHAAIQHPAQIGALRVSGKFFVVSDVTKLLYFWATYRRPDKDVIYRTFSDEPQRTLTGLVPSRAIIAGYAAASVHLKEPPAAYETLHIYLPDEYLNEAIERYPQRKQGSQRIIIYSLHESLTRYGNVTTLPHTFVDIWNSADWYGRDFTAALEGRIHELLS